MVFGPGFPSRPRARLLLGASILAFGMPIATVAQAENCRATVGQERAARLVARCIEVSPATRPPCNADNACMLIESEIARGCRMIDADSAPAFCRQY